MYRIWIFRNKINLVKQPIQSNSVGSWHMFRPFIIILITASLSSKKLDWYVEPECVPLDGTWSILVRSRLVFVVGVCFRMFGWGFADRFPRGSLTSLVLWVWIGEEWNISITKSQRSRAEIPSMRKPASREMTSASEELCESEVCVLHIQLMGTNVDFRIYTEFLLKSILSLQGLLQNQNPATILICIVVLCFPQQYCLYSHVWMTVWDQTRQTFVTSFCPLRYRTRKFVHRP